MAESEKEKGFDVLLEIDVFAQEVWIRFNRDVSGVAFSPEKARYIASRLIEEAAKVEKVS